MVGSPLEEHRITVKVRMDDLCETTSMHSHAWFDLPHEGVPYVCGCWVRLVHWCTLRRTMAMGSPHEEHSHWLVAKGTGI